MTCENEMITVGVNPGGTVTIEGGATLGITEALNVAWEIIGAVHDARPANPEHHKQTWLASMSRITAQAGKAYVAKDLDLFLDVLVDAANDHVSPLDIIEAATGSITRMLSVLGQAAEQRSIDSEEMVTIISHAFENYLLQRARDM
ncbi:hypothetical protein [Corynebacterium pyruviciproducens]|uniref:Uncharacterized protein n=1 Tax=Corynebacterium pyruviciproducens TaxID=598660 RepID=A0AAF0YYG8_9CORY|nr:hypothetical protein [Corynebacterium pyruviciproducens]WOT02880.1 hypothetical protein CYJ47_03675 [Corynebacterium pyruviciproducens]